ncbi:MAG: outer membrane beta-barrel protein [Bryobacteraceae bacterium]|nr:outer membrane beta-barrel protein [Bryobacteraceae bacterium]
MKRLLTIFLALGAAAQEAPRHEIGLTLGSLRGASPSGLELGSGMALQANYGLRLWSNSAAAVYGEVHFLANPQRVVTAANSIATRDVASLYLTPGIRVKFAPEARVSPYFAVGGGYALYEHSLLTIGGQPNPAPRTTNKGAFMFGGGVDAKLWRFIGVRGEIRDFYSGNPSYNLPVSGGQHNVVIGGGFVLRFK